MRKSLCLVLLLSLGSSCNPKPTAVSIRLINNNRAVEFKGLDYAIIREISRDSSRDAWQTLIPVYKMPKDSDMKNYQPVQPGTYRLKDSAVVFTPDTPFAKNASYYMRYFKFDEGSNVTALITNKKKLGSKSYIDLSFK